MSSRTELLDVDGDCQIGLGVLVPERADHSLNNNAAALITQSVIILDGPEKIVHGAVSGANYSGGTPPATRGSHQPIVTPSPADLSTAVCFSLCRKQLRP